jgi:alkylation response protein AidB-like acyl-CoA dehydrogenase
MVKSFLGRLGQKMLVDAIQVEGGMGICEAAPPHFPGTLPLARLFRDIAGTTLLDAPGDFPEALIAASL